MVPDLLYDLEEEGGGEREREMCVRACVSAYQYPYLTYRHTETLIPDKWNNNLATAPGAQPGNMAVTIPTRNLKIEVQDKISPRFQFGLTLPSDVPLDSR
jgi:hypothetical protein